MDRSFVEILINWFPLLLLIGVWIFFMWRMRVAPMTNYQKDHFELTKRQTVALEQIALELAKRNQAS